MAFSGRQGRNFRYILTCKDVACVQCVATQLKKPILSSGQPTADLKVFATKLAEKHQVARFDSAPGIIGISKIQRTWISTFTFSSFTAPDRCRDKELHTFLQLLMSCPFDTFLYSWMSFLLEEYADILQLRGMKCVCCFTQISCSWDIRTCCTIGAPKMLATPYTLAARNGRCQNCAGLWLGGPASNRGRDNRVPRRTWRMWVYRQKLSSCALMSETEVMMLWHKSTKYYGLIYSIVGRDRVLMESWNDGAIVLFMLLTMWWNSCLHSGVPFTHKWLSISEPVTCCCRDLGFTSMCLMRLSRKTKQLSISGSGTF